MIYLHLGPARVACESEATAQRREAMGYRRCTADVHAALWAIANVARLAELDAESVLELPQPSAVGSAPAPNAPASALTRPPALSSMHGWGL